MGTLLRLLRDLTITTTLCRLDDYPDVTLEQLNEYVATHGPLGNPLFGEQPAFFLDDGYVTPHPMPEYGREIVAAKIAECLGVWASDPRQGGRVMTSRGAFLLEPRSGDGPKVRMPDVSYTSRDAYRDADEGGRQQWTHGGKRFAPTFIVEVNKLSGQDSRLPMLDRKMRDEFFQQGVQLAWLIDPRPDCHAVYEYFLDTNGCVQRSSESAWQDLDGRGVLPGFRLRSAVLEMALMARTQEEEDLVCPVAGCGQSFRSMGPLMWHFYAHREDRAVRRYVASRSTK